MSKIAVIYNSKYGATEKYAKWISEETGAELFVEKTCKAADLEGYDVIVYGGAIHAGGILGIKFLQKNFSKFEGKKVLAFAVGLNVGDDKAAENECREINFIKNISQVHCFFCKGAYNPQVVSGMDKAMMAMIKKMLSGKSMEEKTPAEVTLLDAIENGADFTDRKYIAPLVEAINSL